MFYISEEEEFLEQLVSGGNSDNFDESIFKRDSVFAKLNFHLSSGSFKLKTTRPKTGSPSEVIEVELSDVKWNSEVRPRSSTWECSLKLGSVHIWDRMTQNSLFPVLVCPQAKVWSSLT